MREPGESKTHPFLSSFLCIFESLRSNLMINYGIFTSIYVLQEIKEKKQKPVRKAAKMAKAKNAECRNISNYVATKVQDSQEKFVAIIIFFFTTTSMKIAQKHSCTMLRQFKAIS